jgi:high-affinity iron transporter
LDWSLALPTFVITLREGVEAALVVGIVLACLQKAGQTQYNRWVYAGIGAGLAASAVVGVIFSSILLALQSSDRPYAQVIEPLLEAGFSLVAIALLSWMLIWMTQQAGSVKTDLTNAVITTLEQNQQARWGIFSLILIAVLQEGFETVLFIMAQFQRGWMPVVGGVAGLVGATLIGVALFRWGVRINLGLFFQVMGVFLLIIVSGLVIAALKDFDQAALRFSQTVPRWASLCSGNGSCILGPQVWDAHQILPDKQFPGVLLKTLFGYRERLYLVQAIAYLLYLLSIGTLYLQTLNLKKAEGRGQKAEGVPPL